MQRGPTVFLNTSGGETVMAMEADLALDAAALFLRAERRPRPARDCFYTHCGRPLRAGVGLSAQGVRSGDVVDEHERLRGGALDTVTIVLIVVGGLFGLWALYFIIPKILQCLRWFWRRIVAPPIIFIYDYVFTPIGHCSRDCLFTSKEACCDCYDSCDICCNPYKRV